VRYSRLFELVVRPLFWTCSFASVNLSPFWFSSSLPISPNCCLLSDCVPRKCYFPEAISPSITPPFFDVLFLSDPSALRPETPVFVGPSFASVNPNRETIQLPSLSLLPSSPVRRHTQCFFRLQEDPLKSEANVLSPARLQTCFSDGATSDDPSPYKHCLLRKKPR